jgi:hypothetical protein
MLVLLEANIQLFYNRYIAGLAVGSSVISIQFFAKFLYLIESSQTCHSYGSTHSFLVRGIFILS